jgi:hypothetical protein
VSELLMSVEFANYDDRSSDGVECEHPPRFPVSPRVRVPAVLLGLALLVIAAAAAVSDWRYRPGDVGSSNGWLFPVAFVISAFSLICSVSVPLGILRESGLRANDEWKCERDCSQLDKALERIEDKTLSGLARANFKQMRAFTVIAQRQARMSFYASLMASGIALFIVIAGAAGFPGEDVPQLVFDGGPPDELLLRPATGALLPAARGVAHVKGREIVGRRVRVSALAADHRGLAEGGVCGAGSPADHADRCRLTPAATHFAGNPLASRTEPEVA